MRRDRMLWFWGLLTVAVCSEWVAVHRSARGPDSYGVSAGELVLPLIFAGLPALVGGLLLGARPVWCRVGGAAIATYAGWMAVIVTGLSTSDIDGGEPTAAAGALELVGCVLSLSVGAGAHVWMLRRRQGDKPGTVTVA